MDSLLAFSVGTPDAGRVLVQEVIPHTFLKTLEIQCHGILVSSSFHILGNICRGKCDAYVVMSLPQFASFAFSGAGYVWLCKVQ